MSSNLTALLERNRELYCEGYGIFIENKWLKNSRLPILDDIVLFVFNESEYGKRGMDWRLGKITAVNGTQVPVTYSVRGSKANVPPMHNVQRSVRDISILYFMGDLLVITRKHFSTLEA